MEIFQRLKTIRKEKKLTREELYEKLKNIFGKKALKPNSIWRIENGLTAARTNSLHQLCVGLDISLKDLLAENTPQPKLLDVVKKDLRLDKFVYNERVKAEILTPSDRKFLAQEFTLLPDSATKTEEDPIEVGRFEKWVYCLSGKVTCVVGTEEQLIEKGDCCSFESNLPHHFENRTTRKARLLIVQNPRHI